MLVEKINVGEVGSVNTGEIDINAERGGRRRRRDGMRRNRRGKRRDFTARRSRMEGGRRGRSMEERAAFRDRYVFDTWWWFL